MAFRVKDLLINVLPPEIGEDADYTGWPDCGFFTIECHCSATPPTPPLLCYCSASVGPWTPTPLADPMPFGRGAPNCMNTPTAHWTLWQMNVGHGADPGAAAKQLSAMKAQLKQALTEIEEHERRLGDRMQPQTAEEIEALQDKLRDALDELEQRKSKLKKQ